MAPSEDILRHFRRRSDQQIMALELLAISLGLGTFQELLQNRKVVVHCDNTGSEVMCNASACQPFVHSNLWRWQAVLRRGTAIRMDHAQLVHSHWLHAAKHGMKLFVKR